MNTIKMLLQREFWENKGGFLWAPIGAGSAFLALSFMGAIAGEVLGRKSGVFVNGVNISGIAEKAGDQEIQQLGAGLDLAMLMAAGWPMIALGFVVFFYCLSSLYDERKDRSVLFWKSLPISDAATVISKALSATLDAPLISGGVAILVGFAFLLIPSFWLVLHGANPWTLVFGPASPTHVAGTILLGIPVYALWALPTVGWLMLISVWAKSKPFLWAVLIPVFAGIFVSWFDIMMAFDLDSTWFWKNIVARTLTSVFPSTDLIFLHDGFDRIEINGPEDLRSLLSWQSSLNTLASLHTWIGATAGLAMIALATRLRRWRDDN